MRESRTRNLDGRKSPDLNDRKPIGNTCPRCRGHYLWTEDDHHCFQCGYRWNPKIPLITTVDPYCSMETCKTIIDRLELVFCELHQGYPLTKPVIAKLRRQKAAKTHYEKISEGVIRLNAPIMVKLHPKAKKTIPDF